MRIRSILSLAAAAVAATALATPAQAAADGTYYIRDARSGACLAAGEGMFGGHTESCSPRTAWTIRNLADGTAQIVEPRGEGRCLALSPIRIYPPTVFVDTCGSRPDRWTIQDQADGVPVAIAIGQGEDGYLGTQGSRTVVGPDSSPQWILERIG